jgi:hypothetical protein
MAAPVMALTFTDGRKEEVKLNPRVLVEIERKFGATVPGIEGSLYGAWHKLGRPGDFDEWLDSLESIDERSEEALPFESAPTDDS